MRFLSKSGGIGGTIKAAPQDFLVEEIGTDGTTFELGRPFTKPDEEGTYVHFILQKKNWTSASAVAEIGKRLGLSQRHLNVAGIKDKLAISTQLASVYGAPKNALLSLTIKDISINGAWTAKDRVHMGQLLGNRFTIFVRDPLESSGEKVETISSELNNKMPNYFGEQRFGSSRRNTHLIGLKLLRGEIEDALIMFLCDSKEEKNELVTAARKELAETRDFQAALRAFPKHLRLERSLIAYLIKNPKSYPNALRKLPRNILLLFIHAFQSHLFNELLSERLGEDEVELEEGEYFCGETLGFPDIEKTEGEGWICGKLIGYNTPLNEREKKLLESLEISKEAFRMKPLPEISSKGSYRTLFAPLKDFNYKDSTFKFSLPAGSYATVAMKEFIELKKR